LLAGARAQNANPTAVTNGQMVAIAADLAGRIITTPLNYRTLFGSTATTISATGATSVAAAGGASVFRDIVAIIVTTAGAAAQTITFSDGTLSWIVDYPNAAVAPGAPLVIVFGETPLKATTANTAWTANQSVATACHYLVQFVDRLA
jgi:predicted phage tail protein